MKKGILFTIVLLFLGYLAFASGSTESTQDLAGTEIVVLTWEASDPAVSLINVHLPKFEEQTGIKVNYTTMGFADLHTKLATLFASKSDAIDVSAVWKGSIMRFAAPGYLEEITGKLDSGFVDGLTAALSSFTYQGKIYGLPYMQSFRMFYFNKKLFREAGLDPDTPPATWSELLEAAKATTRDTDGDGKVDQWGLLPTGIGDADNSVQDFELLFYLSGGNSLFDDNNNPTFNSAAGKKALTLYKELFDAGVVDPASWTIDSGGDRRARWIQGQTAMVFEWPSLWKLANSSESSKVKGEVGLAPMPKIERVAGIGGDEGLAISAYSKKKEAGLELLKFIAGTEINRENTLRVGWLPVQKALMDDPEIRNNDILAPMIDVATVQNQYYMDRFAAPYSNEISNEALGIAIVDAVNGRRSIEDALAWAEQKSREIVAKY